jgi:sugar lactone lactonase YvrE
VAVQSAAGSFAANPTAGRILRVPIAAGGAPGPVSTLWESLPFDGPDGFAVASSGAIYVANLLANQIAVVGPDGAERERLGSPLFDSPSSARFLGTRLMVANQSYVNGDPAHQAILDVETGEAGQPEFIPAEPQKAKPKPKKKKKRKRKRKRRRS